VQPRRASVVDDAAMPGGHALVSGYDDDPVASATLPEESVVAEMTGDAITPLGCSAG
jgi:hypothetical protein